MIEPSRRLVRSAGRVANVAVREAVGAEESAPAALDAAICADDSACLAIVAAREDDRSTLLRHFLDARSHAARVQAYAGGRVPAPLVARSVVA